MKKRALFRLLLALAAAALLPACLHHHHRHVSQNDPAPVQSESPAAR
jgi:outer membrane biogenesis lipoprotein LolB